MGKPRTEEERQAQLKRERDRAEQRKKNYVVPEYLKEPVNSHKPNYYRFTTRFALGGNVCDLMIQPEKGTPEWHGYPTLYEISHDNIFYGWLCVKDGNWYWYSNEKPNHLAEEIGYIIMAWYQ